VFFVHEIHSVPGRTGEAFETLLREQWAPALAREDGARLVWCVRSMPGSIGFPELITLVAVHDGSALERLSSRIRDGDLRDLALSLDGARAGVTRRVLAPMAFNPLSVDLTAIPAEPHAVDAPSEIYIHDFVPPRPGMQRVYEAAMSEILMKMLELEGHSILIWAGLETVAGGGPVPESLNISHVGRAEEGTRLLSTPLPREMFTPGSWMVEGLKLRDTWTSRLVRSVSWSPIH
jgi:hypothetical protein